MQVLPTAASVIEDKVNTAAPMMEDEVDDSAISASVDRTFKDRAKVDKFKPHHYFDYIAGTSTGGYANLLGSC